MAQRLDLIGTARSLLDIEVNTIVRDNITAEPMPPVPHALLDIAGEYARALCALGVDLLAWFKRPVAVLPNAAAVDWSAHPGPVSDELTVSEQTFERLRWAAKLAGASKSPEAARITSADRALLDRIVNNCDAIKEIIKRFGPTMDQFRDKTRAELANQTIRLSTYSIGVDDLISLQKMWDIGTEEIVAQTVVHVTGDVTTRVREQLGRPEAAPLFGIHRQGIDVSVACWRYLLDVVREIAGAAVGALLGRVP